MTEPNSTQATEKKTANGETTNPNTEPDPSLDRSPPGPPLRSILKVKIPSKHGTKGREGGTMNGKSGRKKKGKKRDKNDLGDDFVPPDGGWGWLVAIAAGVNIFVTFAVGQNFGIIFRTHMATLGINTAELTSIINIQIAVSALTGLLNGPLFRRFTFRQVAFFGSCLLFIGLLLTAFASNFSYFVLAFSCLYGFGRGLAVSASSLAVYTYFKERRRTATAYQFGVAGLGPIIFPYFATYMLYFYDVEGTVMIFAAISLHTIACSLIYQPVMWHVKRARPADPEASREPTAQPPPEEVHGIVEPDTPTLPRSNDGWYGSRVSLNSVNDIRRRSSSLGSQSQEMRPLNSREQIGSKTRSTSITQSIQEETESGDDDDDDDGEEEKVADKESSKILGSGGENAERAEKSKARTLKDSDRAEELEEEERKRLPFYKKVIIFFDLDLLRDFRYLNLALGITLINFVEVNFAILTPFILHDFGFKDQQIAMAMSSLGFCDLVVRFLVPLITSKIKLSNKAFLMIGIAGMCLGRVMLAFSRDIYSLEAIFIWMGLNKALRTVFWSLIIPGYVPLKRLPAAAGLQLLLSGLFSLTFGPMIGFIRDNTSYGFALQFLNALCVFAFLMWIVEALCRKRRVKKKRPADGQKQ